MNTLRPRRLLTLWLGVVALGANVIVAIVNYGKPWHRVTSGFVDGRACGECHPVEHRRWADSHHAKAMQPAEDGIVLADFSGVRFADRGQTARFFKRGRKFFVSTEGPDGQIGDFEIRYTLGVAPLQQYLVALPGGRLQCLTVAWDTRQGRWFALYPDEALALDSPLRWTGRYQNWNLMCAECHTTNLRKGYDVLTDSYQTQWDALGVGCQACHGPGAAHVARARAPREAPPPWAPADLLVNVASTDAHVQVDTCARCHSRRVRLSAEDHAGRPFLDDFQPEPLRAGLYHADGQQLDEVYEYGSFRQSKMYQRGVRCTDCHDPHSGRPRTAGDALCTRCHHQRPYDSPAHHFHQPGSSGTACVNCHMPANTYMVVHARRDHSFQVPRPDLSTTLGVPNACTSCHVDRPPQWAAAIVQRWYGPQASRRAHFASTIAAGRAHRHGAERLLATLIQDPAEPAIVRATALGLLRDYRAVPLAPIRAATQDADPVVRAAAAAALAGRLLDERIESGVPLLTDSVRAVRIEAARALASVPPQRLTAPERHHLDVALDEFRAAQAAMADTAAAHLTLGLLEESLGQPARAALSYEIALRLEPGFVPARTNLAALYDATGRNADAQRLLRDGLTRAPASGPLHYSLGLLLAEINDHTHAADELAEAARAMPDQARVHYNYGLTLQQLGRRQAAEIALRQAQALDPADSHIVYALAIFYLQQQDMRSAAFYTRRLEELSATDTNARQLLERLRQTRGGPGGTQRESGLAGPR